MKDFINPYSKYGKTILFTTQSIKSLKIIEETGRFINKKEYIVEHFDDISPFFIKCYDWFVSEASKRTNKPEDVKYHIWCSVSARNCMRPYDDEVGYVIEVPNEEIIFFSGLKWDYVLNLHYVPRNNDDLEKYRKEMKDKGFKNTFEFIEGRYARMFPMEEKRIKDSWTRIFDIDEWNIFDIQANIWQIKKEWIKHIIMPGESIPKEYIMD